MPQIFIIIYWRFRNFLGQNDKGKTIQDLKSWLSKFRQFALRTAFLAQYYSKKLYFQIKKRAPGLKKLHIESFPAIHVKRMDWMDFILKFSSELLVLMLALFVAATNLYFFSAGQYRDNSLAGVFLKNHEQLNQKLFAKNNSIVTIVSKNSFVAQAQAEDYIGADAQNQDDDTTGNDISTGDDTTISVPNPDSVQSLIAKQIKIYETQKGDTLSSVAAKFGISKNTIIWANKLSDSTVLKPGWQLIILPTDGVLVTATANDTLPDIAHRYNPEKYNTNATVRENSANSLLDKIVSYNALDSEEDIQAGDLIIVPGGQVVSAPVAAKPKTNKTPTYKDDSDTVTSLGSGYDGVSHIFPKGYCTYYVATKMKITFGGNAKNWLANAKASGYVTGKEPAPHSAVVMTGSYPRSMRLYGHVAYVEKVEDGKILISEMNYEGFNKIDYRWVSINSSSIKGYIYP